MSLVVPGLWLRLSVTCFKFSLPILLGLVLYIAGPPLVGAGWLGPASCRVTAPFRRGLAGVSPGLGVSGLEIALFVGLDIFRIVIFGIPSPRLMP